MSEVPLEFGARISHDRDIIFAVDVVTSDRSLAVSSSQAAVDVFVHD